MIDYAKIEFFIESTMLKRLIDSGVLVEYQRKKYQHTWKITYTWKKEFRLEVWRSDGIVTLSGSLHKLYNLVFTDNDYTNFTDFSFSQLVKAVQFITDTFEINPFTAVIRSIEFGVNVTPSAKSINLILAARTLKNKFPIKEYEEHLKRFRFQQYTVKIYDKAAQYRKEGFIIEAEILRLEVHVDKMVFLAEYGIRHLVDILSQKRLSRLYEPLLDKISEIQFLPGIYFSQEPTAPYDLTLPERK